MNRGALAHASLSGGREAVSAADKGVQHLPGSENKVDLDALLRRSGSRTLADEAEKRLDQLLDRHAHAPAAQRSETPADRGPVERLRERFRNEFVPLVEVLQAKYGDRGVNLRMDAEDFMQGGRRVNLSVEFGGTGIRLEGTVTNTSIAFCQTRYSKDDPAGLTASGPSLRTNGLTVEVFRTFVCDRITAIVELVMQSKR